MKKKIQIELLTSRFEKERESDYIEGKFNIKKDMDDKEFNKFLYWIWLSKKKKIKEFEFDENDDYFDPKYPNIILEDKNLKICFYGYFIQRAWGGELEKKIAFEMVNSEDALNELYEEYLKVKDNFDFFTPLYAKALKGKREAFVGLTLLESTTLQEQKYVNPLKSDKDYIYKLKNGEYFIKKEYYVSDPWEDNTFPEKYIEYFFVEPVEKTIIEWKKKSK